jgi:hypothetical protein
MIYYEVAFEVINCPRPWLNAYFPTTGPIIIGNACCDLDSF